MVVSPICPSPALMRNALSVVSPVTLRLSSTVNTDESSVDIVPLTTRLEFTVTLPEPCGSMFMLALEPFEVMSLVVTDVAVAAPVIVGEVIVGELIVGLVSVLFVSVCVALSNTTLPVASGNVAVLSAVGLVAVIVSSLPSALLPSILNCVPNSSVPLTLA